MAVHPRILLADRDASLARTLAWMLKQNGYEVNTATSIELVESRLEVEAYDLVLLDLALLDGHPSIPVLETAATRMAVLAASATAPDPAACGRLGLAPDEVLPKPFQIRDLLKTMTERIRARRVAQADQTAEVQRGQAAAIFGDIVNAQGFDEIARILVRGVSRALGIPRVSLILARAGDTHGVVVAASENPVLKDLKIELARYPEIQRALVTDGPVLVSDVRTDQLYDNVRELWQFDALRVETISAIAMRFRLGQTATGVFFLRTSDPRTPLVQQDVAFAGRVLETAVSTLEEAIAREAAGRARYADGA